MYMTVANYFLFLILCYVLVIPAGLGIIGAAIAIMTNYVLGMASFVLFANCSKRTKYTIATFDKRSFHNLIELLRFGIPNAAMIFFEWGSAEILAIFIGIAGINHLAASVIIWSFIGLIFGITLGLGFATTSLVGQSLGAGKKQVAIKYAKSAVFLVGMLAVVLAGLTIILRYQICGIFSDDKEVIEIA